jgi:hypothetical protein
MPFAFPPESVLAFAGIRNQANTYDVSIVIPCGNMIPLVAGNLAVTESELAVQGIQALIGRDVLSRCLLVYNGLSGILSLAY